MVTMIRSSRRVIGESMRPMPACTVALLGAILLACGFVGAPLLAQETAPAKPPEEKKPAAEASGGPPGTVGAAAGTELPKPVPSVSFERVSDSCWAAVRPDGGGNAGFIVGPKSVLVVDCLGHPDLAKLLLAQIRKVTDKPIRAVVQTHWHYDHTLGNQVFADDVPVLMGTKAAEMLYRRLKADPLILGPAGGAHASLNIRKVRGATETVTDQKSIDLGGEFKVIVSVAGECHSVEDLVVWVAEEKTLFSGDLVSNGFHPILNGGSSFRTIDALARLEKLDVVQVVPGHGAVGKKDVLKAQRAYLTTIRASVKHLAEQKMLADEIVTKLTMPDAYRDLGHATVWPGNVRFVVQEIFAGR